jgi:hypothetical protein
LKAFESRVDSAWSQRLKVTCDKQLSSFAIKLNSRRYKKVREAVEERFAMTAGAHTPPLRV